MKLTGEPLVFKFPACPKCKRELGFGEDATIQSGGLVIWAGCYTCLGQLLLRGIAALDKVDELESRLAAMEVKSSQEERKNPL